MGTRSKGGYKCLMNEKMAKDTRKEPKELPPKMLILSRYRLRTRKYRKIT